jgi:hypothetical protein
MSLVTAPSEAASPGTIATVLFPLQARKTVALHITVPKVNGSGAGRSRMAEFPQSTTCLLFGMSR